jgi:hypothetical protein
MKHQLFLLLACITAACNTGEPAKDNPVQDTLTTAPLTPAAPVAKDEPHPADDSRSVTNDFNGDGHTETAFVVRTKEGHGNPVEEGVPDEYTLQFSDTALPAVNIGCCEARLINEDDLNKDGAAEISVFQAPMNGNGYTFTTWTYRKQGWGKLMDPMLIPTAGDEVADEDLRKRVFLENDTLYFMATDVNDEHFKLVKKKAVTH